MRPAIEWTTPLPDQPSREWIEDSVLACIDLPGVRDLAPLVQTIAIRCPLGEHGVEGVAYNKEGKALIALKYTWSGSAKRGVACAFNDPKKSELLNF